MRLVPRSAWLGRQQHRQCPPPPPCLQQRAPTDAVHPLESLNSSRPRRSYTFPWGAARSVPDSDKSQIPPRTMRFATPSHPPSFAPPHHPSSRVGMRPMLCGRPPSTSRPIRDQGKTAQGQGCRIGHPLQHGSAAVQSLLVLGQPLLTGCSVMPSTIWVLARLLPPGDLATRNEARRGEAVMAGQSNKLSSLCLVPIR